MSDGFHENVETLAAVVECNGFSHAAKYLGISPALVSRRIHNLEEVLGVVLLTRTTRKFELTGEGVLLYQHAKKVILDKQTTLLAIEALSSKAAGVLKMSAPLNFGRQYIASALSEFMKIYPKIEIELVLSNQRVDIIKENFDLVIRGAGYFDDKLLTETSFIAKKLLSSPIILCASPDFLQRHKVIQLPDDITNLAGINFEPSLTASNPAKMIWKGDYESDPVELRLTKQFSCNDIDTAIKMAIEGNGIAKVPEINIKSELQNRALQKILPALNLGEYSIYAAFPQRVLPQRTRLLLDFLKARWA